MPKLFIASTGVLGQLLKLSEQEKNIFEKLIMPRLKWHDSNKPTLGLKEEKSLDDIAKEMSSVSAEVFFKFSFQDSPTSEAFHYFCEHNPLLNQEWKKRLKEKNLPYFDIVDVHGSPIYTVYNQLLAAFLLQKFNLMNSDEAKPNAIELLDLACQLGSFSAITKRQAVKLVQLRQSSPENKIKLAQELINECFKLGETFWSTGYLQSGALFFVQAEDFVAEGNKPVAEIFYNASIEALCMAEQLSQERESYLLMHVINHNKIKFNIGDSEIAFDTWTGMENFVWERAKTKQVEHLDSLLSATNKANDRIKTYKLKSRDQIQTRKRI